MVWIDPGDLGDLDLRTRGELRVLEDDPDDRGRVAAHLRIHGLRVDGLAVDNRKSDEEVEVVSRPVRGGVRVRMPELERVFEYLDVDVVALAFGLRPVVVPGRVDGRRERNPVPELRNDLT